MQRLQDLHDPHDLAIWHTPRPPYAYPLARERIRVRLRVARDDQRIPSVEFSDRMGARGPDERAAMRWFADDATWRYWEADLTPVEGRLRYLFRLDDPRAPDAAPTWFGEQGAMSLRPRAVWPDGYFHWPYLHRQRLATTPAWARDAIAYEIFPDRFARGHPPVAPELIGQWSSVDARAAFWGGDLVGVIESLDYLDSLGVNLLWLTPIFTSPSNHKYNTDDYDRIDPHFGDDAIFQRLISASDGRGMRVILDGVFNHAGLNFAPWRDVLAHGVASPYWGWFDINGAQADTRTRNYRTFAQTAAMPRLMTANPEVQAYLIERAQRWTRMGVAGWRLDVADEVDPSFWRAFRREVRAIRHDAYLVGEIAYDASRWLEGDQFDGVMNYPLRRAALQYFAPAEPDRPDRPDRPGAVEAVGAPEPDDRLDGPGFLDALSRVHAWYPGWATSAALNVLSTHDTPRFLTAMGGDVERLRLALTFLMTYEGIPMLYYGDEVGMEGGEDPDCRRPMLWEPSSWQRGLLDDVRALTRVRRQHPALRGSGFRPIPTGDRRVAAYLRGVSGHEELPGEGGEPGEIALVALNAADAPATIELRPADDPTRPGALRWPAHARHARDLLTDATYALDGQSLRLEAPARSAVILVPED